jgi:hypothetical protein
VKEDTLPHTHTSAGYYYTGRAVAVKVKKQKTVVIVFAR